MFQLQKMDSFVAVSQGSQGHYLYYVMAGTSSSTSLVNWD